MGSNWGGAGSSWAASVAELRGRHRVVNEVFRGLRRSMEVEMEKRRGGKKLKQKKNVEDVENEGKEKVDQTGLKKETREAEGMGLLQWQRKWGGSPDRLV